MKTYTLVGADGKKVTSTTPGTFGGVKKTKLYGRLDCPSALRAVKRGPTYAKSRVFFADEATAKAAGYRPCSVCLPKEYEAWQWEQARQARDAVLQQRYGLSALIDAVIDAERYRGTEVDRAYYGARREALLRSFGVDEHRSSDVMGALLLASSTARCLIPLRTPFDGLMEAPPLVHELYQAHASGLRDAKDAFSTRLHALLSATLSRVVPSAKEVTGADLLAHGFDPTQPDPHPPVADDDW